MSDDERFIVIRKCMDELGALRRELERTQKVVKAQAALIATVYWDDTDMIDDQHTRLLRELADAQAALEAGG